MANQNSALYALQIPGNPGSPLYPQAKDANGKVRYATIEATIANLGATSDTFTLVRLKAGAKVIPGLSKIICESPGTTVTGTIGDAGSANRYLASKALGGSAQAIFWDNSPGAAAYVRYTIAPGNEDIIWTSGTIGTPTTTAKIVFLVAWTDE